MESLRWLIPIARAAGVQRIILNGGFVTDIMEPDDIDCVLLIGPGFPLDAEAGEDLEAGLPFLDISIAGQTDFDWFVQRGFGTDRELVPKGVVEVIQWS
jgi:hypothetical protein